MKTKEKYAYEYFIDTFTVFVGAIVDLAVSTPPSWLFFGGELKPKNQEGTHMNTGRTFKTSDRSGSDQGAWKMPALSLFCPSYIYMYTDQA